MEDNDKTIEVIKAAMQREKPRELTEDKSTDDNMKPADKVGDEKSQAVSMEETQDAAGTEGNVCDTKTPGSEEKTAGTGEIDEKDHGGKPGKPGRISFKLKQSKELEAKDSKIAELTDRLMRTMAEFDNYRKRTEKEKSQMFEFGVKSAIEKLLPIIDNFERGLGAVSDKDRESAIVQGFEMIYKQLQGYLDDMGVRLIESIGKEFDPAYHNAVMHGEDENLGENIITEEFQKGYIYRDIVIRHSMVKVVN